MTLEKVGFMKCRGYPEPGNGIPGLAQDLIYYLQPLQVGSVSQNRCNIEFPQAFPRSLPPQIHKTSLQYVYIEGSLEPRMVTGDMSESLAPALSVIVVWDHHHDIRLHLLINLINNMSI